MNKPEEKIDYWYPLRITGGECLEFKSILDESGIVSYFDPKAFRNVIFVKASMDVIEEAIARGFTAVMIDASSADLAENIRRTREVCELAHARGVTVEAEIGHVGIGRTRTSVHLI